jgi:hypothetical protein
MSQLGLDGLQPLPPFDRDPTLWAGIEREMLGRPFLRQDGLLTTRLTAPQVASKDLFARCDEIVRRFDGFYRTVVDSFYERPELHPHYLINPAFEAAIQADRGWSTALPLSRFDCVIDPQGKIRVIELNPVGNCTIHLRNALYSAHYLQKRKLDEQAQRLGQLGDDIADSISRFAGERLRRLNQPTMGVLTPQGYLRGLAVFWRKQFSRLGWRVLHAHGAEVRMLGSPSSLEVQAKKVDVLWGDYLFYAAYQDDRFRASRIPGRFIGFRDTPTLAARIAQDDAYLGLLRDGKLINVSPWCVYAALPKGLLAWIHDDTMPCPDDRAWLQEHVAQTWAVADRAGGRITREQAVREREALLVKPSQSGGAHGVVLGCEASAADWEAVVGKVWDDPGHVLQRYHEPARTPEGEWISLGLYNYGGRLGAITIRLGGSLVISGRDTAFVSVVPA